MGFVQIIRRECVVIKYVLF